MWASFAVKRSARPLAISVRRALGAFVGRKRFSGYFAGPLPWGAESALIVT